jgi:single-strand DNA-binding protein
MNQIIIQGNIGRDPECKTSDSGVEIAKFSIADNFKKKTGDVWTQGTTWHNCVAFNKKAEIISKWFTKGKPILVIGKLEKRKYTAKDGTEKEMVEVIVNDVHFVSGSKEVSGEAKDAQSQTPTPEHNTRQVPNLAPTFDANEELPF